jgi:hypothetical protein
VWLVIFYLGAGGAYFELTLVAGNIPKRNCVSGKLLFSYQLLNSCKEFGPTYLYLPKFTVIEL